MAVTPQTPAPQNDYLSAPPARSASVAGSVLQPSTCFRGGEHTDAQQQNRKPLDINSPIKQHNLLVAQSNQKYYNGCEGGLTTPKTDGRNKKPLPGSVSIWQKWSAERLQLQQRQADVGVIGDAERAVAGDVAGHSGSGGEGESAQKVEPQQRVVGNGQAAVAADVSLHRDGEFVLHAFRSISCISYLSSQHFPIPDFPARHSRGLRAMSVDARMKFPPKPLEGNRCAERLCGRRGDAARGAHRRTALTRHCRNGCPFLPRSTAEL